MLKRIRRLLSVTAVRLSLIYSLIYAIMAVMIIFYMTAATVNLFMRGTLASIDEEVGELQEIYQQGGINRLIRILDVKARSPGANIYVVTDAAGQIIAGNVYSIDQRVIEKTGWTGKPFHYYRFSEEKYSGEGGSRVHSRHAFARVIRLDNGLRVLIGRDISERENFRQVVGRALGLALGVMLLLGILTWIFVGRRALKRLDLMSQSTSRIMAGDRKERLPVTGNGDEFDRLSTRLNAMLERIFKLDEGLKQVSDNIAHDLKTPLNRLRNKVESALAKDSSSEHYRETLTSVLADCDGLIKTFDALLMISRVESGSAAARLERQDLSQIVGDVAELFEPLAEDEGFAFTLNVQGGVHVKGNRELLSQAIANLIDNALKYAAQVEKPGITIGLANAKGEALLSVTDNGPGIAEADHAHVLQRFTRLEKSRNLPGNGLGLSMVNAIVELHGGKIRMRDGNPGLVVEMLLPIDP